ncbi:MAG: ribbon-helix-helix domain-containing protein [Candidatus Bathyarchaeota archaeon]|nr:ribbon-helix-helix domain-containing protein [Candidatus Bathyarchaeota archaeon]
MPTKGSDFTGVSIRKQLVEDIQKFIDAHPEAGYKSVGDFVQEATRRQIQAVLKTYEE